jgi:serine/threonine protein phosphatase PrpC
LSALQSNLSLTVQQLFQFANDSGGRDNISVILVWVRDSFEVPGERFARFRAGFR